MRYKIFVNFYIVCIAHISCNPPLSYLQKFLETYKKLLVNQIWESLYEHTRLYREKIESNWIFALISKFLSDGMALVYASF